MAKNRTFVFQVLLSDQQVKNLVSPFSGAEPDAAKIAAVAATAVGDLADGGMLLSPDHTRRITDITGPINNYDELVHIVEKAMSVEDGKMVIKWRPDPTYLPYLKETADSQGVEVERYAQDMMDFAIANHWYDGLPQNTVVAFFSPEDMRMIGEILGKPASHISGTEVAAFIRNEFTSKKAAQQPEAVAH